MIRLTLIYGVEALLHLTICSEPSQILRRGVGAPINCLWFSSKVKFIHLLRFCAIVGNPRLNVRSKLCKTILSYELFFLFKFLNLSITGTLSHLANVRLLFGWCLSAGTFSIKGNQIRDKCSIVHNCSYKQIFQKKTNLMLCSHQYWIFQGKSVAESFRWSCGIPNWLITQVIFG